MSYKKIDLDVPHVVAFFILQSAKLRYVSKINKNYLSNNHMLGCYHSGMIVCLNTATR